MAERKDVPQGGMNRHLSRVRAALRRRLGLGSRQASRSREFAIRIALGARNLIMLVTNRVRLRY